MLRAAVMTAVTAALVVLSLGGNATASTGQPTTADRTVTTAASAASPASTTEEPGWS